MQARQMARLHKPGSEKFPTMERAQARETRCRARRPHTCEESQGSARSVSGSRAHTWEPCAPENARALQPNPWEPERKTWEPERKTWEPARKPWEPARKPWELGPLRPRLEQPQPAGQLERPRLEQPRREQPQPAGQLEQPQPGGQQPQRLNQQPV